MAEAGGQEKTESATPKKREDSRNEGNVAYSREISGALLLGIFLLFFIVMGRASADQMLDMMRHGFQNLIVEDLTVGGVWRGLIGQAWMVGLALLGLFAVVLVAGFLFSAMQVGLHFNEFKFQFNRLDPIQGLQRIFSLQGLSELLKSLFKMGVIGYVTYITLSDAGKDVLALSHLPLDGILKFNSDLILTLIWRVTLSLIIMALFDYLFQRWRFEQNIMMTKQELKEEMRHTEGDPMLRSRVRQIQREISRARMMQNVPKADVVVTNPTHFAVALMYDREVMTSPRLVAKGVDYVALRIREIAEENNVPIVENPPVARELYAHVELGEEVPEQFFRTVAEILAYVYRLKGRTIAPSSGNRPPPPPPG
ncbi:MAG: flagellar biosynthesis protein FlhB [Deltaproteobacteria bacterium]|nr:flagellar biosynthesis protein FlhB [Deltaproteobacteria bacterium]